jgi:hydrogenase expression/formation protein HypC
MCIAVPGKIIEVKQDSAVVDFGGVKKEIKTTLTPDVSINDYVLVHAGFSIEKINKELAKEIQDARV